MNNIQSINTDQSRYSELDALRGIAALTVVIWHFFCATYTPTVEPYILSIYFLVHGRASVILFFILSGFVLSLPFFKEPKPQYAPFILRRICRIYLPFLVGIIFAIMIRTFLTTKPIPELGQWFNDYCGSPFSLKTAIEHFFLIGNIHSNVYNNAIWSLIHEMRISLIFPFLFLFVRRVNPFISIATCIVLSGVAQMNEVFKWEISNGWESGYFYSLHIASFFIIGILLAQYKNQLILTYKNMKKPLKITLFIVSIIMFRLSMDLWHLNNNLFLFWDYGSALSACVFIVISFGSLKASRFLNKPVFSLFGKISYSMYLNHITVLYLTFFLLYPYVPIPIIGLIFVILVVIFSYFSWKYVERPSIALGRVLSNKMTSSQT
jgi:peptidoglycan/LPS O-acetylase OafA/YrhL